jgi:general secretion pathway protein E
MPRLQELAHRLSLPIESDLSGYRASPEFIRHFPIGYVREHQIIGLQSPNAKVNQAKEPAISLAISDEKAWPQLDIVSRKLRHSVRPLLADAEQIRLAIIAAYSVRDGEAEQVLESIGAESIVDQLAVLASREDLLDADGRAPIIRLVNQLIFDAVVAGASDIHIQPYEGCVKVRQRIDGVLFDSFEIPKSIQEEVLTRIKVLGKMNIAEKRLPQDGRATVQLGDRVIDLRIASLPTSHNERIVIRLLDKSARLYTLDELGMPPVTLKQWQSLIRVDHGMILVTGPTGSGKSTTLYGALQEINSKEANILTLEDPIEYQLDGISQTQINEKKGMTFASGMRSLLRQDPDIIMVGEIRDRETANMAIQASLTGHLVFSTLHTNDAASAITRLLDLGVEPYLVASSLVASLAQRLVRQLCPNCKVIHDDGSASPKGCDRCRQSGFKGRIGLFELLVTNDRIRTLIQSRENATTIRQSAIETGMTLLFEDGQNKIKQGRTTLDEVLRVTSLQSVVG